MDVHNYPYNSSPEHLFLKKLFLCSDKTTSDDIKSIAKSAFNKLIVFNPNQLIQKSVRVLMTDLLQMPSSKEAGDELSGAIKGLNILLFSAAEKNKPDLKEELAQMEKLRVKIDDFFLIKQAIQNEPDMLEGLKEENFLDMFNELRTLYGRKREFKPSEIKSLLAFWKIPEGRYDLLDFIKKAAYAREMNLYILTLGKIPFTIEKHVKWVENAHGVWTRRAGELFIEKKLSKSDHETLRALIDDIFNQRAVIANTQVHTDSIRMAFNHEDSSKESLRFRNQMRGAPRIDGLESYYPRDLEQRIFQSAQWIPPLTDQMPVQPVDRVIGFAIPGLSKRESTTRLDFAQFLGADHINLNVKERAILGNLLFLTDKIVINDPGQMQMWLNSEKKIKDIPADLVPLLENFKLPECSSLNELSFEQKKGLIDEAFRFAYEVNYHLADDQLNLF